jgi:large subunit ribosomal protein L13
VNADKIRLTVRKEEQKTYKTFSGYPGGQKVISLKRMKAQHPDRVIMHAVKGMLPGNRLGRAVFKKLKVYAGPEHPHLAQTPEKLEL